MLVQCGSVMLSRLSCLNLSFICNLSVSPDKIINYWWHGWILLWGPRSILISFLLDAACKESCDNLWWYSWTISRPCWTIPHWREGTYCLQRSSAWICFLLWTRISESMEVIVWFCSKDKLFDHILIAWNYIYTFLSLVGFHLIPMCLSNLTLEKQRVWPACSLSFWVSGSQLLRFIKYFFQAHLTTMLKLISIRLWF